MNIFALDYDPKQCAEWHVDKHVIKQILEYSQLLSTAHRILDGEQYTKLSATGRRTSAWRLEDIRESILYSATHINHPSAVWARQTTENYNSLHGLLLMLCSEYTYRYGKIHKCQSSGLVGELFTPPGNLKHGGLSPVLLAMPDEYKISKDPVECYREYYRKGKPHLHSWKGKIAGREVPSWM
jgi:hypothetical protein